LGCGSSSEGEAPAISHQPSVEDAEKNPSPGEAPPSPSRGEGGEKKRHRKREPDLRLLCERCGYHLKGLRRSDVCPECGNPVAESLPERRFGSAWQRRPTLVGLIRSAIELARHPVKYWGCVAPRNQGPGSLLMESCAVSVLIPAIPTLVMLVVSLTLDEVLAAETHALVITGAMGVLLFAIFLAFSWIEMIGIRIVASRRTWRIDRVVAWVIVSHASFAWIISSTFILVASIVRVTLAHRFNSPVVPVLVFVAPLLAGLLVFETLVYIGMRKMKFANAPGSERELAPDGAEPAG